MQRIHAFAAISLLAALASAQSLTVPNGYANVEGDSNNAWPWNRQGGGGVRAQFLYDSSHFTLQGVTGPIVITELKWRADGASLPWAGGSYSTATVQLSTCPFDWSSPSSTFAANHGLDMVTGYTGPVAFLPGSVSPGLVGPTVVDVLLSTPFVYDPTSGSDLIIDCDIPVGSWTSGGAVQLDVQTIGQNASRVYASTTYGQPTGVVDTAHGMVIDITYTQGTGGASVHSYGQGCYKKNASFYENFPATNPFDLGSATGTNVVQMVALGNGAYLTMQGQSSWFTPVSANLGLGDDAVSAPIALPFAFPYAGTSTTSIEVGSNGIVWLQPTTDIGQGTSSSALLNNGPRFCPLWDDMDPTITGGGTITYDVDPSGQAVYITWTGVPIWNTQSFNTFQCALFASGGVEFRYQACSQVGSWTTAMTGWSPGAANVDPGSMDLSASLPFFTGPDTVPLHLAAGSRPVLGTTATMNITAAPTGSLFGAFLLGLQQFNPGVSLSSIGMPDCFQFASISSTSIVFFTNGAGSVNLPIPNNPSFGGLHVFGQALSLSPGVNTFGALTSNGLDLGLGN